MNAIRLLKEKYHKAIIGLLWMHEDMQIENIHILRDAFMGFAVVARSLFWVIA